jgi:hypothetical protein
MLLLGFIIAGRTAHHIPSKESLVEENKRSRRNRMSSKCSKIHVSMISIRNCYLWQKIDNESIEHPTNSDRSCKNELVPELVSNDPVDAKQRVIIMWSRCTTCDLYSSLRSKSSLTVEGNQSNDVECKTMSQSDLLGCGVSSVSVM